MKINILLPVFNDWESLNLLIKDIEKKLNFSSIEMTIVDDCSSSKPNITKISDMQVRVLSLSENVGSQRAIKIGLKYLQENKINFDYCVVMDSDGEDKAQDIKSLVDLSKKKGQEIIFASRGKRQDGLFFYILYKFYLLFFFIFTGKNINCGNFSCLPKNKVDEIIKLKNASIHHSASILKSSLPYDKLLCDRGKRFKGKSKMSIKNLILHGINGMAIFFDLIFLRFCKFFLYSTFIFGFVCFFLLIFKIYDPAEIKNYILNYNIAFILAYFFSGLILILFILNYFKLLIKNFKQRKIIIKILSF